MPQVIGIGPHFKSALDSQSLPSYFKPQIFLKSCLGIIGDGGQIELPETAPKVVAEVEIAVKVNKNIHQQSAEQISNLNCIAGYAVCGDLTAISDPYSVEGKLFDTFTPCSEFKEVNLTSETILRSYLNDHLEQEATLADMGMGFNEVIAYVSQFMTISPGDIILTGTPAGVFQINQGDIVKFSSPALGEITNLVN